MDLLCSKHVTESSAVPLARAIPDLAGRAGGALLFHAYWEGPLTEPAFISLLSCFYFNVAWSGETTGARRIIVWTDNVEATSGGELGRLAHQYAEFRLLDLLGEAARTPMAADMSAALCMCTRNPVYYTDTVQYIVLYSYGGVWFDLDTFFLRPLDGLLLTFPRPFVYSYPPVLDCPNGAVFASPRAHHPLMRAAFEAALAKGVQMDFYQGRLFYNTPMPLLVLPGYFFDAAMFYGATPLTDFFEADATRGANSSARRLAVFKPGAFAFHWHRPRRKVTVHVMSAYAQLRRELCKRCTCSTVRSAGKKGGMRHPMLPMSPTVHRCRKSAASKRGGGLERTRPFRIWIG
jgi:hypothetical protein